MLPLRVRVDLGHEAELYIPQSTQTETSPSGCLLSFIVCVGWVSYPLCKDEVGVFYSSSRLDYIKS